MDKYIGDGKLSYGLKHSEQESYEDDYPAATTEEAGIYYDTGVFTKYPESPKEWDYQPPQIGELPFEGLKNLRERRHASEKNDGDASIDVNKQFFGNVYNLNRPERKTDDSLSISLGGFISAIEKQLVSSAQEINAGAGKDSKRKRSLNEVNSKRQINGDDSIDLNKNLFESLFEFTRPQRDIQNLKGATIPLDGLVRAVESTLFNSARHLNSASVGAKRKRSAASTENEEIIEKIAAESETAKRLPRPQRQVEETRIPLRGIIQAIESSLISTALNLNGASLIAKRKRSIQTLGENPVDVSKQFTDRIQSLVRLQRGTDSDQEITVPLAGLIRAIESELLSTAQQIGQSERADRTKRSSGEDSSEENLEKKHHKKHYDIKKIVPLQTPTNLDLLNPITFKSIKNEELKTTKSPTSSEEIDSEESTTSAISALQQSNVTVVHATETTHIIPETNSRIVHVQHQKIHQAVFSSNLAFLPTIPPQIINAPLPTTVPLDVEPDTNRKVRSNDDATESITEIKVEKQTEVEKKRSEETETLRERIAEVQANPVILSAF